MKNDKDDSDSDIEFVDIKPNTGSRPRVHVSSNIFYLYTYQKKHFIDKYSVLLFLGRVSKDRKRRSSSRKHHRSRSPSYRHKSRTRSKTPIMSRPRSHSHSPVRNRSRSRSPYYRSSKYSSHR